MAHSETKQEAPWECPLCTFQNNPMHLICHACDTTRPTSTPPEDNIDITTVAQQAPPQVNHRPNGSSPVNAIELHDTEAEEDNRVGAKHKNSPLRGGKSEEAILDEAAKDASGQLPVLELLVQHHEAVYRSDTEVMLHQPALGSFPPAGEEERTRHVPLQSVQQGWLCTDCLCVSPLTRPKCIFWRCQGLRAKREWIPPPRTALLKRQLMGDSEPEPTRRSSRLAATAAARTTTVTTATNESAGRNSQTSPHKRRKVTS
jgi:hypothetical protein